MKKSFFVVGIIATIAIAGCNSSGERGEMTLPEVDRGYYYFVCISGVEYIVNARGNLVPHYKTTAGEIYSCGQ